MSLRLPLLGLRPALPSLRPPIASRGFYTAQGGPLPIDRSIARPTPPSVPPPSSLSSLRREFSSSHFRSIRSTYFPPGSGGQWGRPPPRGWFSRLRARIDQYGDKRMIYTLIGLNIGVYLLWQYAESSWTRFRDPKLYYFMQRNFVLSQANIMAGRVWTLITSVFSHSTGSHILVNALGLYFLAPAALSLLSGSAFLGLYLGGGVAASLTSLFWRKIKGDRRGGSEGASGALYAVLGFYAAVFPTSTILLFFVIPMPIWLGVGGMFAYDAYQSLTSPARIDISAHAGGLAAGLVAAYSYRRGGLRGVRRMFRR